MLKIVIVQERIYRDELVYLPCKPYVSFLLINVDTLQIIPLLTDNKFDGERFGERGRYIFVEMIQSLQMLFSCFIDWVLLKTGESDFVFLK